MALPVALLAAALLLTTSGLATADNDVGCGVGTMIWEGQEGLGPKIAASSTNGITFQSISITFGILNCNGRDTVTAQIHHFTGSNLDQLALDMATGRGETLTAFETLWQVQEADRAAFEIFTQRHFADLFASDRTTAGEMLSNLNRLLADDARLGVYARS
jgi:hypothetical protein